MITIITPCSRPENLEKLHDSIVHSQVVPNKWKWIVVKDEDKPNLLTYFFSEHIPILNNYVPGGVAGKKQINWALDKMKEYGLNTWVYFLDDDNLMHPEFDRVITQAMCDFPDALAFTFSQELPDGSVRLGNDISVCHIDQAQFIVHTDLIGDLRYEQKYEADGIFIETLYKAHQDKFVVLPNVISYYNKLR